MTPAPAVWTWTVAGRQGDPEVLAYWWDPRVTASLLMHILSRDSPHSVERHPSFA